MKKVEEPCWNLKFGVTGKTWDKLEKWFAENIKDHYLVHESDLVELCGSPTHGNPETTEWGIKCKVDTHKAMLIKSSIEPIEKDSLEKLAKDLIRYHGVSSATYGRLQNRAKALLGEK